VGNKRGGGEGVRGGGEGGGGGRGGGGGGGGGRGAPNRDKCATGEYSPVRQRMRLAGGPGTDGSIVRQSRREMNKEKRLRGGGSWGKTQEGMSRHWVGED